MQYQILQTIITRTIWQTVKRIAVEELKVSGTSNYLSPGGGGWRFFRGGRWGSHDFQGTRRRDQSLLAEYESFSSPIHLLTPPLFPSLAAWPRRLRFSDRVNYSYRIGSM